METREAVLGRADGRMSGVTGNLIAQGGDSSAGSSRRLARISEKNLPRRHANLMRQAS